MFVYNEFKNRLPNQNEALRGREKSIIITQNHYFKNNQIIAPFPKNFEKIIFGLGCFWGAERVFWQIDEVYTTAVGYSGGYTKNPTYEEVCSGQTGHAEVVLVVFDPKLIKLENLLKVFWESHDPTQGNRQGNDKGTQYRSSIYFYDDNQSDIINKSKEIFQNEINKFNYGRITTEVKKINDFYYAENYHQQYLIKVPNGYCGLSGCNVNYPINA